LSTTSGTISILFAGVEELAASEFPGASTDARRMKTGGKGLDKIPLGSTSVPKLDKPLIAFSIVGTSGSPTTIDLTAVQALAVPLGSTRIVDLTGAKLKAWLFETDVGNVGTVKIEQGASNPYLIWGSGGFKILEKGRVEAGAFKSIESQLAAVAAGAKTLKFTFSNTGDKIYGELWSGT
jgi:hypothetical protein